MYENLTPRELAAIKKAARSRRISNIRRRVTITAATVVAIFSGVIFAQSQVSAPVSGITPQATVAQTNGPPPVNQVATSSSSTSGSAVPLTTSQS